MNYEEIYERAVGMINTFHSKNEVLSYLIRCAENLAGSDTVSSILVLDEDGLLRNGSSPRLPKDYLQAIDRLKPHPNLGTCASAAATGKFVITEDFCDDSKWAELKHLPLALGFKGAWSMPITNKEGKVLGTFGTYFTKRRIPSPNEIEGIGLLARAAALALENDNVAHLH